MPKGGFDFYLLIKKRLVLIKLMNEIDFQGDIFCGLVSILHLSPYNRLKELLANLNGLDCPKAEILHRRIY